MERIIVIVCYLNYIDTDFDDFGTIFIKETRTSCDKIMSQQSCQSIVRRKFQIK